MAEALELRESRLFVAADGVSGWGWLPLGRQHADSPIERIRSAAKAIGDRRVRIAVGTVQRGIDGFRQSRQDARLVPAAAPPDAAAVVTVAAARLLLLLLQRR